MRRGRERGAIVVEATLSLTAFVFVIFTILTIVNIFYIQAKMSIALNSAAKEISQYSYLYYKLGVNKVEAKLTEGTERHRATAEQTIDGIGTFLNSMSEAENNFNSRNFDDLILDIEKGVTSVTSLVSMYAEELKDDPKGFIIGMGKMAGDQIGREMKAFLGQVLAKAFMEKNLKAYKGDDPDRFLRRYRVVDGLDGLDFNYSALMANGTSDQIQLVVTYDVEVIKLLNIDFTFTFRQCAKTTAWGNGISKIESQEPTSAESTIWDENDRYRGKYIVAQEKKNYTYTASGNGFDAYNNVGGVNEFITITSINTHAASYQTSRGIKNRLSSTFNDMYNKVSRLDENINVQDRGGMTVPITSNKISRTFKIVLVVPDNADMSIVQQAVAEFESTYGVKVQVKTGYGSPTPEAVEEKEDGS